MKRVPSLRNRPLFYLTLSVLWLWGVFVVGCREKTVGVADNPLSDENPPLTGDHCVDVIFSLNNQDRGAPQAMTDILLDSVVVFHGALNHTRSGDYVYLTTHVHRKKVQLEVRSETTAGLLVEKKNIWVGDEAWIVVSRVGDYETEPELQVVVSYENPHPGLVKSE